MYEFIHGCHLALFCEVSAAEVQVHATLVTLFHRAVPPGMEADVQQLLNFQELFMCETMGKSENHEYLI